MNLAVGQRKKQHSFVIIADLPMTCIEPSTPTSVSYCTMKGFPIHVHQIWIEQQYVCRGRKRNKLLLLSGLSCISNLVPPPPLFPTNSYHPESAPPFPFNSYHPESAPLSPSIPTIQRVPPLSPSIPNIQRVPPLSPSIHNIQRVPPLSPSIPNIQRVPPLSPSIPNIQRSFHFMHDGNMNRAVVHGQRKQQHRRVESQSGLTHISSTGNCLNCTKMKWKYAYPTNVWLKMWNS